MQESPIFVRTYDFIFWLIPQVQKFPRRPPLRAVGARAAPGDGFPGCPVAAGKSRGTERRVALRQADLILEQLRIWLRYARDMELFSISQYEHAARMLVEIGRLLGGWIKQAAA